jgi:hypothetical protein
MGSGQLAQCGAWNISPTPNTGVADSYLNAVAMVSASDAWAVGYSYSANGVTQALIEQWNGTSWSVVSSPNAGSAANYLYALTAVPGTSTLWAVGADANASSGPYQTLTEQD